MQLSIAKRLGKTTPTISRMLNPGYSSYSILDLTTLAEIFDADLEKLVNIDLEQEIKARISKKSQTLPATSP